MKSRYMPILYVGMVLAAFAAGFHSLDRLSRSLPRNPTKKSTATALPTAVPEATLSDIRNMLEKQEYHISPDQQTKRLQSPNRAHNLRAYYEPGKLTVQARVDTTGNQFKLELVNEGIFADGKPLHAPQRNARTSHHDNQVQIMHDAFTEEFINNEDGVRQNFIIRDAPATTRQLQVRMSAKGLKVRQAEGNELRFYKETTKGIHQNELVYSDLKCWDANRKPLRATLAYADNRIQISVDVSNAAYPVTIDPIIANGNPQNANKIIEINQSNMWLGFSVSSAGDINGDGYSDIIAGAPQYDLGQTNEGAAFVFKGSAAGLSLAGVTLECNQADAQMGYSVASAGDFNGDGFSDVLVGIPYYDTYAATYKNGGEVRLYYGSAQGISAAATPKNFALAFPDGNFGISVATAGDIDADGYSDIILGAHHFSAYQNNAGAAFVMFGSSSGSKYEQVLKIDQPGAMFGYSVAAAGDVDADGFGDVIVGSRFYASDQSQAGEGAAYIYRGSSTGLLINNPMIIEGNQFDAAMGYKVSTAGDVNGDGYSDILLSASMYDNEHVNEGRVYLHLGSSTGINPVATKIFEGNQTDARIGTAIACAGDVNGDGYADILLGSQYFDNGQNNEGAVFVYHGSASGVADIPASFLESNQGEGWFGTAVASAGDVNGDGYSDILVGCYTFDNGQNDEGHVFLYHGGAEGIGTNGSISLSGSDTGALIGYSVADAGDVNSDGFDDVIVGAPEFDFNGVTGGIAMVFYGSLGGIDAGNKLIISKNQAGSYFGNSVAGAGDVNGDGYGDVIIGASDYSNGQSGEGVAFLFYGSNSGIDLATSVVLENDIPNSDFGGSVSGAGDINRDGYSDLIMGDGKYSVKETFEGAAFIYYGSSGGPINKTVIESNLESTFFGHVVSSAGDVNGDGYGDVVVGASDYSSNEDLEGAIFIFHGSNAGIMTNNPKIIQSNQPEAMMGLSVSGAGDVNGDGYGDIVVGAPGYDKNETNEGIVKVYYGTSSGISEVSSTPTVLEQNVANAGFGISVKGAGDVNGDGYTDITVGAVDFLTGNVLNKGRAFVYHGSPSGIKTPASFSIEGKDGANLGAAVSGAGDVNGDGYSDIIVGAPYADNGQSLDVGSATVYYGNNGKGLKNNVRLFNSDLATPINHNQFNQPNFVATLFTKSFLGKNKGKFVWEAMGPGIPFSKVGNAPITTSNLFTGASVNFANLSAVGAVSGGVVVKNGIATKVRVRVRYSPVLAITGQVYGPWRYLQSQLSGYNNAPVPDEMASETMQRKVADDDRVSVVVYPNPVADKLFIKTENADQVRSVRLMHSDGKLMYVSENPVEELDVKKFEAGVYVLLVTRRDGSQSSHKVVISR